VTGTTTATEETGQYLCVQLWSYMLIEVGEAGEMTSTDDAM